jgi:hypothetical protein
VDCPADREADFCIVRTSIVDRGGLLTGSLEYFEDSSKGAKYPEDASMELYVGVTKITTEQDTVEFEERASSIRTAWNLPASARSKTGPVNLRVIPGR